jgi:hypothetical protein
MINLENVNVNDLYMLEMENNVKPTKEPQEIIIFPRGKYYVQRYDKYLNFNNDFFGEIINNFDSKVSFEPFMDKQHELKESYGDIENLTIKDNGLYATLNLNDLGVKAIKSREYRYLSPSFGELTDNEKKLHKNVLFSVSLTNVPALLATMPKLQEQLKLELGKEKENKKEESKMTELNMALGLNSEASDQVVLNAVLDMQTELEGVKKERDELKYRAEKAEKTASELGDELKQIENVQLEKEAKEVIKLAIDKGQYHPKLQELKISQYKNDKESVLAELALLPEKPAEQMTVNTEEKVDLSQEDRDIMKAQKLDPSKKEDIDKFKEWTKE